MSRQQRPITDREIKAWLAAGAVDRGVGEGLTFVASSIAAQAGKASWILRYRLNGRSKEKVLGRYPELSLKDAREQVRRDRAQIERGIDVTAAKQAEKALQLEVPTVQRLGEVWFAKYIQPRESLSVLEAQCDRAVGMVGCLLLELARTIDTHHGQLDPVPGQQALRAEADRRLSHPGPAGDLVARSKQVAVEREIMRDEFGFECSEQVNAGARSGCDAGGLVRAAA